MKKTLFFIVLSVITMISTAAFAQNAPIDFETGGYGADWTWTVFENDTNPPVEIITNPDMSAPNESATVAKFTALQTGQPWAGCETLHGSDIGTFNLDETNCTIKIMVWKPVISDVGIKLVKPDGWSLGEIKVANTVVNEWEELTFNFFAQITDGYDQIVIFPDFDLAGRTQDNICYFDNITFHPQTTLPEPDAPATTPTIPADNVISLFSNAYTNVSVDTWSADWDQADVTDVQIEGDDVKLYTNLVYAGVEFTSQTIDASAMTYFCMDIWTPDPTAAPAVFKIKLVDFGADGAYGGGDDVEHELVFDETTTPALVSEEWIHFNIPLADFTGLTTTEHLAQMIISADPNTVYVDNVFFHNYAVGTGGNLISSKFDLGNNYPNPFNPTTSIEFNLNEANHVVLGVYNVKGEKVRTLVDDNLQANSHTVIWNGTDDNLKPVSSGIYFYKMRAGYYQETKKMILLK
ncbi:MAG: T9SS type A sorting domain-containing protein [Bacteroidales bacterium]|nr:T9SS type A sorting domain-containing protein [Bacteroidales bacterium]